MSAERDLLDWVTVAVAVTALVLSIRNAWASRQRFEIHLEGAFLEPAPGRKDHGEAVIVVRNPTNTPMQLDDIGLRLQSGRRVPLRRYDVKLPVLIEPGASVSGSSSVVDFAALADPDIDNDPATHAWIRLPGRRYRNRRLPKEWLHAFIERTSQSDQ